MNNTQVVDFRVPEGCGSAVLVRILISLKSSQISESSRTGELIDLELLDSHKLMVLGRYGSLWGLVQAGDCWFPKGWGLVAPAQVRS